MNVALLEAFRWINNNSLPLPTLRNLGQALFDFSSLDDLQPWLDAQ